MPPKVISSRDYKAFNEEVFLLDLNHTLVLFQLHNQILRLFLDI